MSLLHRLSEQQRRDVTTAADVSRSLGTSVWLVGGAVRDLLLERPAGDLDFTVEGDAGRVAARIAEILDGRVTRHERFLTYRIDRDALPSIDVVTARSEWYSRDGALPDVAPGALTDDLLRRDFTVNAIALDVCSEKLVDPADGVADVEHRRLRILHPASFSDDITRLYRGARLSARLDFRFQEETLTAARRSVRDGALRSVSVERLWREVRLLLDERDIAATALRAMLSEGWLEPLFGSSRVERFPFDAIIASAAAADVDALPLIAAAIERPDLRSLSRAGVPLRDIEVLPALAQRVRTIEDRSRSVSSLRTIAALERLSQNGLVLASATTLSGRAAAVLHAKHATIHVDSADVPPQRRRLIGRALKHTRIAMAAGLCAIEDAGRFAQSRLIRYLQHDRRPHA